MLHAKCLIRSTMHNANLSPGSAAFRLHESTQQLANALYEPKFWQWKIATCTHCFCSYTFCIGPFIYINVTQCLSSKPQIFYHHHQFLLHFSKKTNKRNNDQICLHNFHFAEITWKHFVLYFLSTVCVELLTQI